MPLSLVRVAGWLLVAGIILLSVLPGPDRPHSGAPGHFEHVVAYLLASIVLALVSQPPSADRAVEPARRPVWCARTAATHDSGEDRRVGRVCRKLGRCPDRPACNQPLVRTAADTSDPKLEG